MTPPVPRTPAAGSSLPVTSTQLARARQARQLRVTMGAFLPRELLVDPAWDMMIDLFVAAGTGERLCVKDLILLSGESPASAIRRIDRLQQALLLERHTDVVDHRRVYVGLTDRGLTAIATMLEHLFDDAFTIGEMAKAPRSFSPDDTFRAR